MKKLLPILVVIMLFVAGGVGYFTYGAYQDYKDNEKVETIDESKIVKEEIENIPIEVPETKEVENESPKVNTPTSNYSIKSTSTITKPTAKEVYNYAQGLFDVYTNYGDNYVPEVHDDLVLRETAEHFGISVSEADNLYYKGAMDY